MEADSSIQPGRLLLHYRLIDKIGEGGMGVVWRAEDTTLQREVAIKILPDVLAGDTERLARFAREARMLAALNHPNIAAVYGMHEAEGVHFLAMELVSGEDLSERIARGPLPIDEALEISRSIAEALRTAHGSGVIHRDLKPANIRIGVEGEVKVLDFGLAKMLSADGEGSSPRLAPSLSPTMTSLGTMVGTLLGTAAYMSPEQARGKPVDRRADIWAFGCVLFEMLTGKLVFHGETITDTLAAVVRADPDWERLPAGLPRGVGKVLRLCLAKDQRERLSDIADVALLMDHGFDEDDAPAVDARAPKRPRVREMLAWGLALGALALAVVFSVRGAGTPSPTVATRFTLHLSDDAPLSRSETPILTFSPDGRTIVFVALDAATGSTMLYLRTLDQTEPWALPGTEGATSPFFSPDGEQIGFFARNELKRISRSGGTAVTVASAPNPRGGVWLPDDTIVYSPEYASGLWRVSASGGSPELAVELDSDKGERTFRWPSVLPDGKTVLFTVGSTDSPNNYDRAGIAAVTLGSGKRHEIIEGANMARFARPNKLVFTRAGTLFAVDFDPASLSISGDPVPCIDGVGGDPSSGAGFFDVSRAGDLIHVPGAITDSKSSLVLVDRKGQATALPIAPRGFFQPRFAPDGASIAFAVGRGALGVEGDIWVYSFEDEGLRRVTFDGFDLYPLWQPDGARIAFLRAEDMSVAATAADGGGGAEVLLQGSSEVWLPNSWSPDGKTIAFTATGRSTDVYLLTVGEDEPRLFAADASGPAISPDGRWLAYQSPSSGYPVIYVQPLVGEGKWQVSLGQGGYPRWSPDGRSLFFIELGQPPQRFLMEAGVAAEEAFRVAKPQRLFDVAPYVTLTAPVMNWDTDGERFAFVELARDEDASQRIEVTLGWAGQL